MSLRWRFVEACSPILKRLPPWWRVRVYGRLAGDPFEHGMFDGRKTDCRIAPHGYLMELHLDDWMERKAALTGVFYAIEATEALQWLLRPGDTFIDIGANIGFMTLTATHLVGSEGKVVSVEPNIELHDRLTKTLKRNHIENVEFHQCAIGDEDGHASLHVHDHHGASSLRQGEGGGLDVRVIRGDQIVPAARDNGWCVVKIDVEGFEEKALKGLSETISRPRTAFLIEVTDSWLKSVGGGAVALFSMMSEAGYSAFQPIPSRASGFELRRLDGHLSSEFQYDAIFIRDTDDWKARPRR